MGYLMGLDIGTSGTKAVLFRTDGQAVASHTEEYPMAQPRNGWAEQAPEDWWRAVCLCCRSILASSGVKPEEIRGVGLSGQMHGLVMLNGQDKVLRPAILWCDQRTAEECAEITEIIGVERLMKITANPALTGFTASKIRWVQKHEPQLYQKCRRILLPKDYVRLMLTGEYATEVSDASGMQLLDVPRRQWSDEVLGLLGIGRELLGTVYESCEITGTITEQAAKLCGLAPGTPVAGGAGDNAAAAVGTGVVTDGKAFTTIGSSGVVYAHASRPRTDPRGRVHTFCSAVPGEWHVMGVTQGAGLSLKWFRDNFCGAEKATAAAMEKDPYYLMDKAAELVPPGSNRLLYLPYLMGERTPHLDPDCRGVFFGLSAIHTKRDMLRAVMEGVAYSLKDCCDILDEMGVGYENMLVCGGGGSSPLWRQILADVYGCPVRTTVSKEGPALGAAILAGVGTGVYSSVPAACREIVRENPSQAPDETVHGIYGQYHALYKQLYDSLKDQFVQLGKLS